jgi:hypothetical protein
MTAYKANASVIFTDADGRQIDTFVIFDTDTHTGLTHINHENLKVPAEKLQLHGKTVCDYHLPIADAFSFEMIKKLRDKYEAIDSQKKVPVHKMPEPKISGMQVLAKAS